MQSVASGTCGASGSSSSLIANQTSGPSLALQALIIGRHDAVAVGSRFLKLISRRALAPVRTRVPAQTGASALRLIAPSTFKM
jgi:hypothetical protein